jgi:nucleoside-diphosphate-sugar epimerase
MKILVTGANGLIGSALLSNGSKYQHECTGAIRGVSLSQENKNNPNRIITINSEISLADWRDHLVGIDVVVHCAGLTFDKSICVCDSLDQYEEVNVKGTAKIAQQAAIAGVKRFVYLSSIKVSGESTDGVKPISDTTIPAPVGRYAISKLRAETELKRISRGTDMSYTIIRPPLVYGLGCKGNLNILARLVEIGLPLPFGGIQSNRRSLIGLQNLVDLIMLCVVHPNAADQTFLASDDSDLSTLEILNLISGSIDVPLKVFNVSPNILAGGMAALGMKNHAKRLIGSLQVDITKTKNYLGWTPPISVFDGFKQCFSKR